MISVTVAVDAGMNSLNLGKDLDLGAVRGQIIEVKLVTRASHVAQSTSERHLYRQTVRLGTVQSVCPLTTGLESRSPSLTTPSLPNSSMKLGTD